MKHDVINISSCGVNTADAHGSRHWRLGEQMVSFTVTDTEGTHCSQWWNQGKKTSREIWVAWWSFLKTIVQCVLFFKQCPCEASDGSTVTAVPLPELTLSSDHCCGICWCRLRRSLPPGTSIFDQAQKEHWPRCLWVPSATTEGSKSAILAIYSSCQLGSCFLSCWWCARQAWSLLTEMERWKRSTALISKGH